MNILFVIDACGMFGNPKSGGSNRSTLFVKALTQLGHVDVCSFSDEKVVSDIKDCDVVYQNQDLRSWRKIGNPLLRGLSSAIRLAFRPHHPNSYYETNEKIEKIVDDLVRKNKYELIACHWFKTAINCGLLKYKENLVIDVDDDPTNYLKKIAASFKSSALKTLYRLKEKGMPYLVKKELEKTFVSFYSNISEPPSPTSVFLHNTTICMANIPNISQDAKNRLLFVGDLCFYPNQYGIKRFVTEIYPLIKSKVSDVELYIVGKGSQNIQDVVNRVEGVTALGFVEDISVEYDNTKVVVIPIYHGSGTAIKFVEAMFMNRPIVSSPIGARGFNVLAKDNEHYLLAKNDEDFANKTVELLLDTEKSNTMANKAYELAKDNFSQDKFMEIVEETIETKLRQKQLQKINNRELNKVI